MVSTPQSAVPDAPASGRARKVLAELAPFADSLSKGVAALAIGIYVCGFLTVSLHHANYGFVGTSPFRPRILAAGAWFIFLIAIPVGIAARYKQRTWISIAGSLAFVLFVFYGISNAVFFLLFDLGHPNTATPYHHWWYWGWGAGALATGLLYTLATQSKKATATFLAIASTGFVLLMLGMRLQAFFTTRDFELGDLALWFFGIFVITVFELKSNPGDYSGDKVKALGGDLFLLLATLFVFGHYYYPHIKASWGGGAPVDVVVYFTKDSAVRPNQSISAELVEESDEGFYIVGQGETKALYVPRNAVALVYFADSTSGSSLLTRDNK
jgi:hypothetical protein